MGGRVARFGFIPDFGRALFVTASHVDSQFYYDHYVKGPVEEMTPALNRKDMDKHILNLVASEICHDAGEIKTFLKNTFTGKTVWDREMTDADYDQTIGETIAVSVKWGLIEEDAKGRLTPTPLGKNTAAKGITLETAVSFVEFLRNTDSRDISDLELLMLMALSRDALEGYIPLKKSERGSGGYYEELKRAIYDSLEESKAVYQSVWKISGMLAQQKERAVKKALMLNQWISNRETREIEEGYEVFSGAIKRVGEDFSWLTETLASLAKEVGWDTRGINRITTLSQRLIYGVTEKGLALSKIRIRGLGRTYINRLIAQGFDTPEAIAELPLAELEKHLPKHLAERLYHHFHRDYEKKEETVEQEKLPMAAEGRAAPMKNQIAAAPAMSAQNDTFPRPLAEILQSNGALAALRACLVEAQNLGELVTDPPVIFMDEQQQVFFYQGIPIKLQPACFNYLLILAERPKQIVQRDEIYRRLWPGSMNYDGSNKPYERQISDHKRRCIAQIRKGISGKVTVTQGELEALIFTKPKVGYMLNLPKENMSILSHD